MRQLLAKCKIGQRFVTDHSRDREQTIISSSGITRNIQIMAAAHTFWDIFAIGKRPRYVIDQMPDQHAFRTIQTTTTRRRAMIAIAIAGRGDACTEILVGQVTRNKKKRVRVALEIGCRWW